MPYVAQWAMAFALTQCVEMGVYASAQRGARPLRERLAIAFGASGITHPLVWFVIPEVVLGAFEIVEPLAALGLSFSERWWVAVAHAEVFAVSAEALFLSGFGVRPALLWALGANVCSFLIGLFCYRCLGW